MIRTKANLQAQEAALAAYLNRVAADEEVSISVERLARSEPVTFDQGSVALVEEAARRRGLELEAHDLRRRP